MTRQKTLDQTPEPPPVLVLSGDDDYPLYTPRQVGMFIDMSEWWVRNEARYRRIPFTRVGNKIRYKPKHVRRILAALCEVDPDRQGRKPNSPSAA